MLTPIVNKANKTDYVTLPQLAKMLGVWESYIHRWVKRGGIQPSGYLYPYMVWSKEAAKQIKDDWEDFKELRKKFPQTTKQGKLVEFEEANE